MVQGRRNGTCLEAGVFALAATLAGGSAPQAQDLPKVETTFASGATLRFYGQINKGVLSYGDGQVSETCDLIDNDNSNTRFGPSYTQDFAESRACIGIIEIADAPFSTLTASILQPSPPAPLRDPNLPAFGKPHKGKLLLQGSSAPLTQNRPPSQDRRPRCPRTSVRDLSGLYRRVVRWPRSRVLTGSCKAAVAAGGERRCLS